MADFKILNGYNVKDNQARNDIAQTQTDLINFTNLVYQYNSYETTETYTGQAWIDSKPIYRKVIDIGPAFNNIGDLEKEYYHEIDFDTIVRFDGFLRARTSGDGYYTVTNIPVVRNGVSETTGDDPQLMTASVRCSIDKDKIVLSREFTGSLDTLGNAYFIIEYTKRTV